MSLLKTIRDDSMAARRAGDKSKGVLVLIISEAMNKAKAGNREVEDDDVLFALKKTLKGVDESLRLKSDPVLSAERDFLQTYLPEQVPPMSHDDLIQHIKAISKTEGIPIEPKSTGRFVKIFNEAYPGQVDGRTISELMKAFPENA